ncbi:unnamed protein product [Colias eurytheme]|nr:unnamed protein product [Colias eurytheme]
MEPFVEIPHSAWNQLRDAYTENWPRHLIAHTLMNTQLKYPGILSYLQLKIYCPFGELANGIIAISDKEEFRQIMILPLESISIIEESFMTTKLIDWNKPLLVQSASDEVIECTKRISAHFNLEFKFDEKANTYYLDKQSAPFENLSCPPDTYIGPLTPEHIDLIDKTWTYTGSWSRKYFEVLMKNGLTYVLYSTSNEPLAWITVGSEGALTHLYCLEPHRQKGYAEVVTKYAINDQLKANNDILSYTLVDNVKPQKLFKKLGFQYFGNVSWVLITPK